MRAVVLAMMLLGCATHRRPAEYIGPPLAFEGVEVTDAQKEGALNEWIFQTECTGFKGRRTGPLPVEARLGFFACVGQNGSIPVNGCTMLPWGEHMGRIQVNSYTYVAGVSHELIHWMLNLPDPTHEDPVWERCDHLNQPIGSTP